MKQYNTAFLTVDKSGEETIWHKKPERLKMSNIWIVEDDNNEDELYFTLPKGTIKLITGIDMTWNDDVYTYNGVE